MLYDDTYGNASAPENVAMRVAINNSTAKFHQYVDVTLKDGVTNYTFDDTELYQGGLSFENAICGSNQFPIGTMVTGKCVVKIFDTARTYPSIDFYGARIIPYIEVVFDYNGSSLSSIFQKGAYTCNSQKWNNGVFTIEGLDDIDKLNKAFSKSWFGTTATGASIITTICTQCGITTDPSIINCVPSETLTIPSDPMTCRDVLRELTGIGFYLYMDNTGVLDYSYVGYSPTVSQGHTDLVTSQYSFTWNDYIEPREFDYLYENGEVRYFVQSADPSDNIYILSFTQGAFLSQLSGYELSLYANAIGMHTLDQMGYYLADVSAVENPLIEPGDGIFVTDRLTSTQKLIIASNVRYTFGQATQVSSYGRPIRENNASGYTSSEVSAQMANNALAEAKAYTDSQLASVKVDRITSNSTTYTFRMQNDGNAVLYNGSTAEWNTNADITWKARQDEDPQRLYTSSAASTVVAKNTSTWTDVQSFTVSTSGWYLVTLIQYVNLASNATSGHIAMRIVDGNSRNHNTYIGCYAIRGGGTMSMSFIGYFAANTTYNIKAINTTTVDWTMNRTLGDAELMLQYLHRDT